MKATQKLAIVKLEERPNKKDTNYLVKVFKNTDYRPIFVVDKVKFNKGNLIIG